MIKGKTQHNPSTHNFSTWVTDYIKLLFISTLTFNKIGIIVTQITQVHALRICEKKEKLKIIYCLNSMSQSHFFLNNT